jgi:membrane-bound serine protease (ClpP class)
MRTASRWTARRSDLDDIVHPITADYVRGGLSHAKDSNARAVILRVDTPGGLIESMRAIVEAVLNSPVPVIVWVGPNGARAASAGFFILLAADLAVMAPGANTGAAHPVGVGGGDLGESLKEKIVNDATAYLRSYVSRRGRDAAVAETGVLESKSFTAEEALQKHLIDGISGDIPDLLRSFDGHVVRRMDGSSLHLQLANAQVEHFEMGTRQRLLSTAMNPNVALVLGLLGLIGIYIEVTYPGLILPGVVGGISLILALFAFNLLPVNWAGAALIAAAIVLFVLEATVVSHGILAMGGVAAMIAGSLMLVEGPIPQLRISLQTTLAVTLPVAALVVFLARLVILSQSRKRFGGDSGVIGEIGVTRSDVHREGLVFVHGELWKAYSNEPIKAGAAVRVVEMRGLAVGVVRADDSNNPS